MFRNKMSNKLTTKSRGFVESLQEGDSHLTRETHSGLFL